MKKNSIDLFIYLLKNRGYLSDVDVAKAKAMHKEEMKKSYWAGIDDHLNPNKMPNSEGYYELTFGGNNEQQ